MDLAGAYFPLESVAPILPPCKPEVGALPRRRVETERLSMKKTGNTILVTGGGSGIGRAMAEAFHAAGNKVIVAGRRRAALEAVVAANPGIEAIELDVSGPETIAAFAKEVVTRFPTLDVLVNNAGVMKLEKLEDPAHVAIAEETIVTNLLGPIRLTAALIEHLSSRPNAAVINVTSGLAFVPLALTPTYSATKAALHSWSMSQRHQLAGKVEVIELAPPYVQTELMGPHQAVDPRAMPLADFIAEVMDLLGRDPTPPEIIVERCRPLRFAAENGNLDEVFAGLTAH